MQIATFPFLGASGNETVVQAKLENTYQELDEMK